MPSINDDDDDDDNNNMLLLLLLSQAFSSWYIFLKQWVTPPFRVQVSGYSTFHIMCDVFCSESVECFPNMAFRFF